MIDDPARISIYFYVLVHFQSKFQIQSSIIYTTSTWQMTTL